MFAFANKDGGMGCLKDEERDWDRKKMKNDSIVIQNGYTKNIYIYLRYILSSKKKQLTKKLKLSIHHSQKKYDLKILCGLHLFIMSS